MKKLILSLLFSSAGLLIASGLSARNKVRINFDESFKVAHQNKAAKYQVKTYGVGGRAKRSFKFEINREGKITVLAPEVKQTKKPGAKQTKKPGVKQTKKLGKKSRAQKGTSVLEFPTGCFNELKLSTHDGPFTGQIATVKTEHRCGNQEFWVSVRDGKIIINKKASVPPTTKPTPTPATTPETTPTPTPETTPTTTPATTTTTPTPTPTPISAQRVPAAVPVCTPEMAKPASIKNYVNSIRSLQERQKNYPSEKIRIQRQIDLYKDILKKCGAEKELASLQEEAVASVPEEEVISEPEEEVSESEEEVVSVPEEEVTSESEEEEEDYLEE